MSGHRKWADIKRKSKTKKATVEVGTIWYHPMGGSGRPFIIRKITDGVAHSENLDDGGTIEYPIEELITFLTENPKYLLDGS